MISGSAALLIQAYPTFEPLEIKALLMNTAETNILINPVTQPGVLAPISRIGGGEVRVNRAFASRTAAWEADDKIPSLSFGYNSADVDAKTLSKMVEVHNYGNSSRTYFITTSFRYASDLTGAVQLSAPPSVTVPAHESAKFKVKLTIDATKLPVWTLNGGSRGGDGFRLQEVEFDGFVNITSGDENIHLPWHILPHRAADVNSKHDHVNLKKGPEDVELNNKDGAVNGRVDVFSLMGESRKVPKKLLPGPGDNFAVVDMKALGVRLLNPTTIQFAVNTWGTRAHPNYPAEFDIYVDSNRDGEPDYVIFNLENGGFGVTGQNVVGVFNLTTNSALIVFFTDADLNSGNIILTAPLSLLGLTPNSKFDFSVYAFDNYFTGDLTDSIEGMTYTPSTPRYIATGVPAAGVPAGGSSTLSIEAVPGGDVASPSQSGILLMYRDGNSKHEADTIEVHK
jgi:hypothetical protein